MNETIGNRPKRYQRRNIEGKFKKLNRIHMNHKPEIEAYMNRAKDPLSPDLAVSMVARDVRFQHEREKKHELSTEDGLTGLDNRRLVFGNESKPNPSGELRRLFLETRREEKPLSVMMLDIDHFKKVNDVYGHDIGDFILKQLAKVLKKTIRESDIVARIGGEEFLIILQNTDLVGAKDLAEKIREVVEKNNFNPDNKENMPNKITISAGVSTFTKESKKIESETDLFKAADKALSYAKEGGRNQVWVTEETTLENNETIFHIHGGSIRIKKSSKLQVLLNKLKRR